MAFLIMEFLFFLLVGVCVGTFGTLIGLGGGLILVPLFMYTMYAPDGSMIFSTVQQIIGTSLFAVACNAVSGAYAYMKQKRIMFRAAIPFALSTIPGAFCGSFVSKYFTGASFSIAFGCLLVVLGCFMYWKSNSKRATARPEDFDPATAPFNLWLGVVLTFGVGFISTIFGIGGGIIDVPMMVFILGFPAQIATASSTFILMVSSLVGTISHASLDHIIWVPAICIGCGCVIGAQIGARIAKKSKPRLLVIILSVTMVLMGINLVVRGL